MAPATLIIAAHNFEVTVLEKLMEALSYTTTVDGVAVIIFFCCWVGYRYFADSGETGRRGLVGITHEYRLMWAMETSTRDIPVACASLVNNLMQSVSFYASTTIYIIAGLIALIGTIDRLEVFTADLPFATTGSRALTEMKILLLIIIFVVAYFKFTWSIRQFNFLCILIGAAPQERNIPSEDYWRQSAKRMARINSQAGNEFHRGIRAYYYGIATLGWFINAWVFIVATLWITWILYRRDFHSKALQILRDQYPPTFRDLTLNERRFSLAPSEEKTKN